MWGSAGGSRWEKMRMGRGVGEGVVGRWSEYATV